MGRIKKLKNGKYRATAYDENGIRSRPTFSKKSEAEAYLNKIEAKKHDRKLVKTKVAKSKSNIYVALDEFEALKKENLRPKSFKRYKFIIDQFRLFLQGYKINTLDEFTTDHASILFQLLIKEKKDPTGNTEKILKAKPKTVNMYLQMIRSFFQGQVKKDKLVKNPMDHIEYLKEEKQKPEYYSEEELAKFFSIEMPEHLREAFLGLIHTGCRIEEFANVTWDDIDFPGRVIHIRSKGTFKTKTINGERTLPMNGTLYSLLENISRNKRSEQYVFSSKKGSKLRERRLLEECKAIAKTAGIKSRVFLHKFRHTYATHLVQRGVRIEVIQKLLGHSSYKETLIYAHVRPEELHNDVAVLDNLVPSKMERVKEQKPEVKVFHLPIRNQSTDKNKFLKAA